jgi:signal peptidase I
MSSRSYDLTDRGPYREPVVVSLGLPARPWVAAVLGFFCPGLGQLYAGYPLPAALWGLGRWVAAVLFLVPIWMASAPGDRITALIAAPALALGYSVLSGLNARHAALARPSPGRGWFTTWWAISLVSLLVSGADAVFAGVVMPRLPLQVYTVEGGSMLPGVQSGDRIVTTRARATRPRRGTLVLYRTPDTNAVQLGRIVASGGETLELRNHRAVVNGVPERTKALLTDPSGAADDQDAIADRAAQKVPAGQVFILGDNRANSHDSRAFGPVPIENIVATPSWWLTRHDGSGKMQWSEAGEPVKP